MLCPQHLNTVLTRADEVPLVRNVSSVSAKRAPRCGSLDFRPVEEKHGVSIIGLVALRVDCMGEPPVPAVEEPFQTTSRREPRGARRARLQLGRRGWLQGAPCSGPPSPPGRLSVFPNQRCRDQSQRSPSEEAGAVTKDKMRVSAQKSPHSLRIFRSFQNTVPLVMGRSTPTPQMCLMMILN